MTPEQWEQIGQLYYEAKEIDPPGRAAFLDQACVGDESLRREVEALLAVEASVGDFIAAPALKDAAELLTVEAAPEELVGKQVSHYQILSLIGAGGMGEVYAARDMRLGRKVAVKLLPAIVSRDADRLRRFDQEAFYGYAWMATQLLIDRHGVAKVISYFERFAQSDDRLANFREAFGEDLSQFETAAAASLAR